MCTVQYMELMPMQSTYTCRPVPDCQYMVLCILCISMDEFHLPNESCSQIKLAPPLYTM